MNLLLMYPIIFFLGVRTVKKHLFGRALTRTPLMGYEEYEPISKPTVNLDVLKENLTQVHHTMCLGQVHTYSVFTRHCRFKKLLSLVYHLCVQRDYFILVFSIP